jgi:hypothetical protein
MLINLVAGCSIWSSGLALNTHFSNQEIKNAAAAEIREITGCAGLLITDSRKSRFRFAEMKNPLCAEIVFPAIFFQEGISSFTCRYRESARRAVE